MPGNAFLNPNWMAIRKAVCMPVGCMSELFELLNV
jgi:hypothetical protein